MKVGIVVPYSWSFWGGVVEHAEAQMHALEEIGVDARLLIGHDPPGSFSRILHPRQGRAGPPPPGVIPLGRSVIVPGNGALSNLVLSPRALPQLRRALARERFDVLHVHEPLAPMLSPAALALWDGPTVATFHAAGDSAWRPIADTLWGFLQERIDLRIAVSEQARVAAAARLACSETAIRRSSRSRTNPHSTSAKPRQAESPAAWNVATAGPSQRASAAGPSIGAKGSWTCSTSKRSFPSARRS